MNTEHFSSLLKEMKTRYIPDGYIELFNINEVGSNHFLNGVPLFESSKVIHMETKDNHHLFYKIKSELFLQVSSSKAESNLGILKTLSKKIADEVKDSTMKIYK